jgi:hypothetical protein
LAIRQRAFSFSGGSNMESFDANVTELPGKAAKPERPSLCRFSQLSASRQALVRLCQATNFGQIQHLEIRDGDPVLSPPPLVLIDVKLDADEAPRPESDLPDFELSKEVRRLIGQLHELATGIIEHIEVRAGIPRRLVFRGPLTKVRHPLPQTGPPDQPASEDLRSTRGALGYER